MSKEKSFIIFTMKLDKIIYTLNLFCYITALHIFTLNRTVKKVYKSITSFNFIVYCVFKIIVLNSLNDFNYLLERNYFDFFLT